MRAYDELEIRTAEGVTLRAVELGPETARASVVLVHGLRETKEAFANVSAALVDAGLRTIAFDFHDGDFDACVRDLAAVVECVGARAEGRPVIVVAHGFGARIATAAHLPVGALVLLGGSTFWRVVAATPLAWRYKKLAGAALAPSRTELRVPVVDGARGLDARAVVAAVKSALEKVRT